MSKALNSQNKLKNQMKSYINKTNFFWLVGILFLLLPKIVRAEDDEECDLCNIAAGAAIAVCEEFAACRAFMFFTVMIFLFVTLLMCICGGPDTRRDMWNSMPSGRQAVGGAAGYYGTRALLRRR